MPIKRIYSYYNTPSLSLVVILAFACEFILSCLFVPLPWLTIHSWSFSLSSTWPFHPFQGILDTCVWARPKASQMFSSFMTLHSRICICLRLLLWPYTNRINIFVCPHLRVRVRHRMVERERGEVWDVFIGVWCSACLLVLKCPPQVWGWPMAIAIMSR